MSNIKEMIEFLDGRIADKNVWTKPPQCDIAMLTKIKGIVENSENESLCDDCEWFNNPGACPDYDESKCRYNAPMEEER